MGILLSKGSRSYGSEIENEVQVLSAFSLTLCGGDLYVRDPNPPVLLWSPMFTGWEWSPGATVSLLHTVDTVPTAFIWSGHCSCRHNSNNTAQHPWIWTAANTYNVSCYNIVIQAMYSIIHICTSYRVLYNIYCDVYQESSQKLFKLIALRVLKFIFWYLLCFAQYSVQQATIRKYFQFSFFELSNFRI